MRHIDKKAKDAMGPGYYEIPFLSVGEDVSLGENVKLSPFVNLYGCTIGDDTSIGAFVEIGSGVTIGKRCKIGARVFIPPGITIGDEVFVGPCTIFTNDKFPRAVETRQQAEWLVHTTVGDRARIGAGCLVLPGLTIGEDSFLGAGTIITTNVIKGEVRRSAQSIVSNLTLQDLLK